ncbi:hypothetical protein [Streptomyces sp. NPDC051921]|uniref:hypothetical protein n=1 Tax=Streptomyces sp. NPDC051921 TaxID=3155806 RepID=UPI0034150A89
MAPSPPAPGRRSTEPAEHRNDGRVAYVVLGCARFLLVSLVGVIFAALLTR